MNCDEGVARLLERTRSGDLAVEHLHLAAYAGDRTAMEALGEPVVRGPEPLRPWVWGLSRWGKSTLVQSACLAAREALPMWEDLLDDRLAVDLGSVREALLAAEAWLRDPGPEAEAAASMAADRAWTALRAVDRRATEATVVDEATDLRILRAGEASCQAALAAAWSPRTGVEPELDEAERSAREALGPALEATEAVWCGMKALEWREEDMRSFLGSRIAIRALAR